MNGLFNQTPHLKSFQYENSLLKSTKLHLATFSKYPEANSKPEVKCQSVTTAQKILKTQSRILKVPVEGPLDT